MKKPSPKVQLAIGVVVSLAFFIYALKGLDFVNLVKELRDAELVMSSALTLTLLTIAFWIKAVRWSLILKPLGDFTARECLPAVCIGFMGNNIYPARLGEFLRAYAFSQQTNTPFSSVLSTLFIERLFDLISILIYFYLAIWLLGAEGLPSWIHKSGVILAAASVVACISLIPFIFATEKLERIAHWLFDSVLPVVIASKLKAVLAHGIQGLQIARQPVLLLKVLGLSMVHWLVFGMMMIVALGALGLELSLPRALFLQAVTAIAVMIPAAPGNVGIIQYAFRAALEIFPSISILKPATHAQFASLTPEMLRKEVGEKIVAAAIFYNIFQHIPVTLAGLVSLRVLGVDINEARAAKQDDAGADSDQVDSDQADQASVIDSETV